MAYTIFVWCLVASLLFYAACLAFSIGWALYVLFVEWAHDQRTFADGKRNCARCWDAACTGCPHGKKDTDG